VYDPYQRSDYRRSRRPDAAAGFTLIELVTVITILAVLAAFAVPRFLDMRGTSEQAVIDSFVGSMKTARTLAYSDFLSHGQLPAGYLSPRDFTLFNLTRCDSGEPEPRDPADAGGHYIGLGTLREGLFRDPDQMACAGNQIQFTTKSGRTVTISGVGDVTWSASPAY
jgi:prepilin-type N-terminal cleavage/methylation domain-containing protein